MALMGHKKRDKPKEKDLRGFKDFKVLSGLLESLHAPGCQRDRAHNPTTHQPQTALAVTAHTWCKLSAEQE